MSMTEAIIGMIWFGAVWFAIFLIYMTVVFIRSVVKKRRQAFLDECQDHYPWHRGPKWR